MQSCSNLRFFLGLATFSFVEPQVLYYLNIVRLKKSKIKNQIKILEKSGKSRRLPLRRTFQGNHSELEPRIRVWPTFTPTQIFFYLPLYIYLIDLGLFLPPSIFPNRHRLNQQPQRKEISAAGLYRSLLTRAFTSTSFYVFNFYEGRLAKVQSSCAHFLLDPTKIVAPNQLLNSKLCLEFEKSRRYIYNHGYRQGARGYRAIPDRV